MQGPMQQNPLPPHNRHTCAPTLCRNPDGRGGPSSTGTRVDARASPFRDVGRQGGKPKSGRPTSQP
eukprot:9993098-Lingulodinium_polyedra.AAC.1